MFCLCSGKQTLVERRKYRLEPMTLSLASSQPQHSNIDTDNSTDNEGLPDTATHSKHSSGVSRNHLPPPLP